MSDRKASRIDEARAAVAGQAELMHGAFGRARSEIKHDGTRVTEIDLAISRNIQRRLADRFPEDQFFSEELAPGAGPEPVRSQFSWMLDPIDGTNNYANGIVHCAISLALLEHGKPAYGVIYDMARRSLIQGGPGRGVWDGERPARARDALPNSQSLVGFHSPVDRARAEDAKRVIESFKIRGLGSSTLHLAYTAIGLLDGVVEHNNRVWDIAAACALLPDSGAEIRFLDSSPFPLREFSVKAPRVRYIAGSAAMCEALARTLSHSVTPADADDRGLRPTS